MPGTGQARTAPAVRPCLIRGLHSHSIILNDHNALIYQRKNFLRGPKNRIPDPSEIRALEFKG
jgi:hypothetical protein